MFCSNCGKQIPDGSAFCPECGATLGGAQAAPQGAAMQNFQQGFNNFQNAVKGADYSDAFNMNRTGNLNNTNNPVNIIVGEGAVQLDARDLTVKESRQVMINALQGLGMIKNIELNPTQ